MSWGKYKTDPADTLFSLYIRHRDNWTCKKCGKKFEPPTNLLHCSHFVGRAKENTRFMPENADAICFHDHQYFTSHPMEHLDWQVQTKGQKEVDRIKLASHIYCKKDRKLQAMFWRKKLLEDFGIKA